MTTPKTFNGISVKSPFFVDGKELVIQYEVKVQESPVDCGGAYIKILNTEFEPHAFNDSTKFAIMFGPDKCGSKNKVQYIQRTENPITNKWDEHALKNSPAALWDNFTHLYRLVLTEDQRFEISIDGVVESSGSLMDETLFDPPFEPPKNVPDLKDIKPVDWVDEAEIVDVNDTKPEDWDEDAPEEIPDTTATKPDDWDESMPLYIDDPEAKQPDDWNEEEDGKYEIPKIENPECESHGCGPWSPPMIPNPDYKGKWSPRKIPNPAYKGPWKPREIPNKNHFTPSNLHILGQITGIGIDVLALTPHVLFDNIYVGRSLAQAQEVANDTWVPRHEAELNAKKIQDELTKKRLKEEQWSEIVNETSWSRRMSLLKDYALDWFYDNKIVGSLAVVACLSVVILIGISCGRLCGCCKGAVESTEEEEKPEETDKQEDADNKEDNEEEEEGEKKDEEETKPEDEETKPEEPKEEPKEPKEEPKEEKETKTEEQPKPEETKEEEEPQKTPKKPKKSKKPETPVPEQTIPNIPAETEEPQTPVTQRQASSKSPQTVPRSSKKSKKPKKDQ